MFSPILQAASAPLSSSWNEGLLPGSITRRTALGTLSAAAIGGRYLQPEAPGCIAAEKSSAAGLTLGFSTYGMQSLATEAALRQLADIGYDSVELCLNPGFDAEPKRLARKRRDGIAVLLRQLDLKLTALMEHLPIAAGEQEHQKQLGRLQAAAQLAHQLAPEQPPLVETVLGGGEWKAVKELYVKRLADWVEVAKREKVTIAIKPHRGGAMSRPAEAIWLLRELGNPREMRIAFDYSHYVYRDMPLEQTLAEALPWIGFVAVKDTVRENGRTRFVLPGEAGTIDYAKLLSLLYRGGYRGDVSCEVSGMVWRKPGYDPAAAAKTCYKNMAAAFARAEVPRA